jgi:hypothetical protein
MTAFQRTARGGFSALALAASVTLGACAGGGGLGSVGDILGGVLGGGAAQGQQVTGTVRSVDTRSQQLSLEQSNGQTVSIGFDANTQVIYQNQRYQVTSLEYGDQIGARVRQAQNGGYYTDSVWVRQPVQGSTNTGGGTASGSTNVQSLQGVVRQVDRNNGLFTMDTGNGVQLTVSMPYRPSSQDATRFNNLRSGDSVRLYGVFLNNSRVELRQFY